MRKDLCSNSGFDSNIDVIPRNDFWLNPSLHKDSNRFDGIVLQFVLEPYYAQQYQVFLELGTISFQVMVDILDLFVPKSNVSQPSQGKRGNELVVLVVLVGRRSLYLFRSALHKSIYFVILGISN